MISSDRALSDLNLAHLKAIDGILPEPLVLWNRVFPRGPKMLSILALFVRRRILAVFLKKAKFGE